MVDRNFGFIVRYFVNWAPACELKILLWILSELREKRGNGAEIGDALANGA